jgi:predicted TIM-barrel fold metal-dependent hydrolase
MIIDIHGHITPPELLERFPMPPALGDIEGMIEEKHEAGIDLTIVGSPVGAGTMIPVPGLDNFAQTDDELKRFHEWLAGTVREHPGRLKAYVYANPFGDDAHLEQAAELLKEDEFVGLIANTSVRGEFLDSERTDSFFAMASQLDAPIFLHPPAEPVGSESLRDRRVVEQVARFCDMTMGLAAIVFAGRLDTYPRLRLVGAMAGGAISLLPGILDMAPRPDGIFVDTATASTAARASVLRLIGAERLLFGTDSPPASYPLEQAVATIENLPISEVKKAQILSGNAKRLFGLDGEATARDGRPSL